MLRTIPLLRRNKNNNSNQVKEFREQKRLEVSRQWLVRLLGSSKQAELQ